MNRLISRVAIVLSMNALLIGSVAVFPALAQDNNPTRFLKAPSAPVEFKVIDLSATSVRYVGEGTSFYSVGFQATEQWQAFLQSEFAKHVLNSKVAQKFIGAFNDQWDGRKGDIGQARGILDNPNVSGPIDVLLDSMHEEVFVYGDSSFPNTLVQINDLIEEMTVVASSAAQDPEQIMEYLKSLDKGRFDQIAIPTIVFGGKVSNKDAAVEQLSILEAFASIGLSQAPPEFKDGFKHIDDEAGTRLSMTLASSMIPWDQMGGLPGEFVDELRRLIEGRQFTISLGLLDEFLVFAISENPEDLLDMRDVASPLLESSSMALVKEKSKLPILGIGYVSDEFAEANYDTSLKDYFSKHAGSTLAAINSTLEEQMMDAEDESDSENASKIKQIIEPLPEDLHWLDEQIAQHVPKFRGQTAVSVARPDGMESWVQYRTESVIWDSQPKLPILEHLGGKPLSFIAARRQYHPEYFQTCRLIAQKAHTYLEKMADLGVLDDEDDEEKLDTFLEDGWPLLVKFADIIEQDIIPSTKDGQFALVLTESNVKAKKYANDMIESKQDLPLPEFAKIVGTNDSVKLVDGFEKLYGLGDEIAEFIHEIDPDAVAEGFAVPRPESRSNPAGQNFFYPLPKEIGIPESILPQSLFAKDFAYFTYSGPQLTSILKPTPLTDTSSFIKEHKSIAAVMYVDFGRIFAQFKPWAIYAADQEKQNVAVPARNGFPEVTKADLLELYDAFTKIGELVSVEYGSEAGSFAHIRQVR